MEADFLKRIVKEAEEISKRDFGVRQKGDRGDLVTDLDYAIEQFLVDKIKAEYPDFDIVSEEFNTENNVTDNCFIIDPIDGTINFANGLPLWGIQVACRRDGKTVASVIDLPRLNEFYYADESGAYCNDERISANEVPIKNAVYSVINYEGLPITMKIHKYSRSSRSFGSAAVAFAFMAHGRIHGAAFCANSPWDTEPGIFLCEKAGAVVKNEDKFHTAAMNQELMNIFEEAAKN